MRDAALLCCLLSVSVLFQSLLTGYVSLSKSPAAPQTPKTVPPQPVGNAGQGKAAVNANSSLAKVSTKAAPADSSSSDSSDSDTDVEQVSANHKAGGSFGKAGSLPGTGAELCWRRRVTLGPGPAPVVSPLQNPAWGAAAVCWLPLAMTQLSLLQLGWPADFCFGGRTGYLSSNVYSSALLTVVWECSQSCHLSRHFFCRKQTSSGPGSHRSIQQREGGRKN